MAKKSVSKIDLFSSQLDMFSAKDVTSEIMNLTLSKPLAFIDLETTGINLSIDRIIEIAIVKISPDGTKQVKRKIVNPQMPIPKGSTDMHGFTDEMVKDAPAFKDIANEIMLKVQALLED